LFFERRLIVPGLAGALELDLEGTEDLLFEPGGEIRRAPAVRFRSSFTEKDASVVPGAELEWRLLSYQARASWHLAGGAVSSEANLLGFAPDAPVDQAPTAPTPRMAKLHLTGVFGALDGGVRLESVSPGLESVIGRHAGGDREGTDGWLALRLGRARLRASVGELSDNVLEDRHRSRTTREEAGLAVELTLPRGLFLSAGASRGTWDREPARRATGREARWGAGDFDRLFATLYYYGGPRWNVSLSSSDTASAESEPVGRVSGSVSHSLSLSLQPAPSLGITPTVGLSRDDTDAGTGSRTVWTSLSLWAAPLAGPLDLTVYADSNRSHTLDAVYDGRSVYAGAGLTWHLRRRAPTATLGLEAGYYRYLDAASGSGRYEETVAQVVFKLAAF
ncbi:MAG: hypothetical protein ACREMB_22890, partial [Candidatus Rokuibacteriota bacterium]